MVIIKWTNKFSNETGYVESVSTKGKCFVNTFEAKDAKQYTERGAKGMLKKLEDFGETENNVFELVEI